MSTVGLDPFTPADTDTLAVLARRIWHQHYPAIITREQIDYMLAGRFTPEQLARYGGGSGRGLALLRVDGVAVGYCSWSPAPEAGEMKLEQLYLLLEHRGQGLGLHMLQHVEARARAAGCTALSLTVNRNNHGALDFYRRQGFATRAAVRLDIGAGYVMDDFILAKPL